MVFLSTIFKKKIVIYFIVGMTENEFIYHERMPQNILEEIWDLASEDVETDFPQGQSQHASVVQYINTRSKCQGYY